MKIIAWLFGGFIFSVVAAVLIALATLNMHLKIGGVTMFLAAYVVSLLIALTAPTGGRAWRRLLVLSGVMCLLLPVAGLVTTGSMVAHSAADQAAGNIVAGGLVSLLAGVVGFFLGAALIIVGLLCGRSPQIIYLQQPPPQ
jgi:hypothetical protein